MKREALEALLDGMGRGRVALIGDLCLDMYWRADMRLSELSRETPHFPLPVVEERTSPGGAGNVAGCAAALKPASLRVAGLVGSDWRGRLLTEALEARGVGTDHVVRDGKVWTNTYVKPLRSGLSDLVYEDPRLDFENRAPLSDELEAEVLRALETAAAGADVLLVSDQMAFGCVTEAVRERICRMGEEGLTVVVDSRSRIGLYRRVIVKPNEQEARSAFGGPSTAPEALALTASLRTGRPALVTLGPKGCLVAEGGRALPVPGVSVPPPIDTVGAGDAFLAALGCALAGGAALEAAAFAANLAAAVTVGKINTTGTATREEILALYDRAVG